MIRYRDNAATTHRSEQAAKHVQRLGTLYSVRGYVFKSRFGKRTAVMVKGLYGTARFSAFAWGYGGTGPNGLNRFLQSLGIDKTQAAQIAFHTSWETDTIGTKWEINLQTPACEVAA
jgi:hypothetical protein